MKTRKQKVLPFPTPPQERAASIICQVGSQRYAIHYQIEDLPPARPLSLLEEATPEGSSEVPDEDLPPAPFLLVKPKAKKTSKRRR